MRPLLFATACVTLLGCSSPRTEAVSSTGTNAVIEQRASDTSDSGRSAKSWTHVMKLRTEPPRKKKTRIV